MKVRTAERRVTLIWIPQLLLSTCPSTLSSTRLSETMTMLVQVPVSLSMLAFLKNYFIVIFCIFCEAELY
jgi:hypothetical protein